VEGLDVGVEVQDGARAPDAAGERVVVQELVMGAAAAGQDAAVGVLAPVAVVVGASVVGRGLDVPEVYCVAVPVADY